MRTRGTIGLHDKVYWRRDAAFRFSGPKTVIFCFWAIEVPDVSTGDMGQRRQKRESGAETPHSKVPVWSAAFWCRFHFPGSSARESGAETPHSKVPHLECGILVPLSFPRQQCKRKRCRNTALQSPHLECGIFGAAFISRQQCKRKRRRNTALQSPHLEPSEPKSINSSQLLFQTIRLSEIPNPLHPVTGTVITRCRGVCHPGTIPIPKLQHVK